LGRWIVNENQGDFLDVIAGLPYYPETGCCKFVIFPEIRPLFFDRINRINRIKEKGHKYPKNPVNPVNPVKITG
jgi:hypothetical protein